jgi:hypothetical protein
MASDLPTDLGADAPLGPLSLAALETLLAALDPRLDGFGEGPSCLDDARAYLNRLAGGPGHADAAMDTTAMVAWIESWRAAGGNRQTLRLMVQTLIAERLERTVPAAIRETSP